MTFVYSTNKSKGIDKEYTDVTSLSSGIQLRVISVQKHEKYRIRKPRHEATEVSFSVPYRISVFLS